LSQYGTNYEALANLYGKINYYMTETSDDAGKIYGDQGELSEKFGGARIYYDENALSLESNSKINEILSSYSNLIAWAESSGIPKFADGYGVPEKKDTYV
jgi:hypothetical protein